MSSDVLTRLTEAEKSFKKACEQILQLNRRLDDMAKRYDKASRENHRSFRYSLRLRMAVTEGVRNMYYEYAANKADEITNLRCQVGGVDQDADPVGGNRQAPANNNGSGGGDGGGGGARNPHAAEVEDDNHMSDLDSVDNREEHDDPADAPQPDEDNADEVAMMVGQADWVMVNVDSQDGESSTSDLQLRNLSVPNLADSESDVDSAIEQQQSDEYIDDVESAQHQDPETDAESTESSGAQASQLFGRLMPFSTSHLPSQDSASSSTSTCTHSHS